MHPETMSTTESISRTGIIIAALATVGACDIAFGLTLQLIPPFTGIVAIPAWAWAIAWLAIVAALAALGAFQVG